MNDDEALRLPWHGGEPNIRVFYSILTWDKRINKAYHKDHKDHEYKNTGIAANKLNNFPFP